MSIHVMPNRGASSFSRLLAAAIFALSLSATAQTASAQGRATVTVGKPFLTNSADPTKASNSWALTSHGVAQNLYTIDREGRMVPQLAESVTRTGDNVWQIRLRQDVRFSDGAPMTAAEVVTGLERTLKLLPPARASVGAAMLKAIDGRTIEIRPERPVAVMESVLAEWALVVYRVLGEDAFAFTGPYRIVSVKANNELALEPNPHYPGADNRPAIRIRYFADTNPMALALEAGELDLAFQIPAETLGRLRARGEISTTTILGGYQYYVIPNTARPPLDDARVRRAIQAAMDPSVMVRAARGGEVSKGFFPPPYPFSLNETYQHDPALAVRLLDEAGWRPGADGIRAKAGKRLSFSLVSLSSWPDMQVYSPIVRSQLAKVGIDIVPRVVENFLAVATPGDFDLLFRVTHGAPAGDPIFQLNDALRSTGSRNFGKYKSAELDRVLIELEAASALDRRWQLAREAQRMVRAEAPIIPLAVTPFHIGTSKRLKGYEVFGADYYILRDDLVVSD